LSPDSSDASKYVLKEALKFNDLQAIEYGRFVKRVKWANTIKFNLISHNIQL
jgi:hypothetical protein